MGSSWIVHEINVYVCLFLFDSLENRCKIIHESFSIVFYLFHISKSSLDFGYHLACEKEYTGTDWLTVAPSAFILRMERTVSLCVTVMLQTVIISTVVNSLQKVGFLIIIVYYVQFIVELYILNIYFTLL